MWPTFLLQILLVFANTVDAVRGPTSPDNEAFHWAEAQKAFDQDDHKSATHHLKTLMDRYPSNGHMREALLMLGVSLVETGQARTAKPYLERFLALEDIAAADRLRAKAALARVAIAHQAWDTARALTHEMLRTAPEELEAHLLKAKLFHGMGKIKDRQEWLFAFQTLAKKQDSAPVRLLAESDALEVEIKLAECPVAPFKGRGLDESTIRAQVKEQGLCLQEALIMIRKGWLRVHQGIPEGGIAWTQKWFTRSIELWSTAYQKLWKSCFDPVRPSDLPRGKRSVRALAEFRDRLLLECKTIQNQTGQTIEGWKPSHPVHIQVQLNRMLQEVRKVAPAH